MLDETTRRSLRHPMSRRRLLVGGVAMGAAALLAACGGDDDEETPAAASSPAATSGGQATATRAAGTPTTGSPVTGSPTTGGTPTSGGPGLATSTPTIQAGALATLRFGQAFDLDTLDPTRVVQTPWRRVYGHMFDPLFHRIYDQSGREVLVPKLALSYEQADEKTLIFKLRQGVKFTNGEDFNADSVVFTWKTELDPKSQASGQAGQIENIEAMDPYTVKATLKQPDPFGLDLFVDSLFMVPPKTYGSTESFSANPIGTGPYMLEEWRKGDSIILKPNPQYWGGPVLAQRIIVRVIPEASTRVDALIAGEIDICEGITPLLAEKVENSDVARLSVPTGSPQPIWASLMTDRPGLEDKRVRQAINYAVNKEAIVERVLRGFATPMGQLCAEGTGCYNPNVQPYPYDPDKAKQLLQEAGVQNLELSFQFSSGVAAGAREVAQAIATNLAAVGIKTEPVDVERGQFLTDFTDGVGQHKGFGDISIMYYAAGVRPQNVTLKRILKQGDSWNSMHYKNDEVEAMIQKALTSFDPQERQQLYYDIAEQVYEDAPILFLYAPQSIWGVSDKLKWEAQPDDMMWAFPESFPL